MPGVELGVISAEYGVYPNARYDSLRSPKPEVVEAMLQSWRDMKKTLPRGHRRRFFWFHAGR
ncbi:MAG UNVERIFIED_CONTAM: hypothetical protein LVR29_17580 [Microcystis novacekii LVE1205-3]